ncbi:MAG: flagellar protein FlgN [Treponema sp.]|nr:flagellar protein FlgN [Treponema sp.]
MATISPGELKQRVAVIKRFKELLKSQRDRFSAYLDTLDRQKEVIETGNADDLLRHVELEEKIVADIFSIQKVIDPLEKMYQSAAAQAPAKGKEPDTSDSDEVSGLKQALDGLKAEAIVRSERNRELLTKRMTELRSEIKGLKGNPYTKRLNGTAAISTHVDIRG